MRTVKKETLLPMHLYILNNKVIIKLDIKDFFPSITEKHLRSVFRKLSLPEEILERLIELVSLKERGIPQGAPTSPMLSNLILKKLDHQIKGYVFRMDPVCGYSRYADDITISLPEDNPENI